MPGIENAQHFNARYQNVRGVVDMRPMLIFLTSIIFCCVCSTAGADIYAWVDENGIRHYTNYAPPPQAKIIMKTEELPYDRQADTERMESERLDQLNAALQAVAEKETQLAEMQLAAEKRIEEANRKAQEALEQAEALLNEAQGGPYGYGGSRYGYYPYGTGYNQSIYNRWYYHHSGSILYKKHHYKNRHKHYYKKKYNSKKRHAYKYRGGDRRHYKFRTYITNRRSTAIRGGFVHRSGFGHRRTIGTRSFRSNR